MGPNRISGQYALWIRTTVGVLLLAGLIAWIGPWSLWEAVDTFSPWYYLLALSLLFLHFYLQSGVLHTLLHTRGRVIPTGHIFRVMVISHFFGLFLPGGVGPDMVLCYNMVRSSEQKETALSAVIFLRIAVLFVMALVAFGGSFHPLATGLSAQLMTGAVVAAFVTYFVVMANPATRAFTQSLLGFLNRHHLTALLFKTYVALSDYGRDRKTVWRITPWLLASALIKIVTDYFIARSLGFEIPLLAFFIFIPLITVISAVPLTFAGLGIREGAYVGLFALAGVPPEQALTVSLVSFSLAIVTAIIGAVLYIRYGATLIKPPVEPDRLETETPT